MLAPWPIGDKLTRRSDLCNNAYTPLNPDYSDHKLTVITAE